MKRNRIIIALVACAVLGFAFGLACESFVGKAYAKTDSAPGRTLPDEIPFESVASGSSRSAEYEIIYIYGKKYIVFSSGGDIEVLEY